MANAELLTARSSRVKAARRLRRRIVRSSERSFLAEGPQAVREALRRPDCVVEVFATYVVTTRHDELQALADGGGVPWHLVDEAALKGLADTVNPQGVVAVCRFLDCSLESALRPKGQRVGLVVVAADVRDPGNAGTLIRCADAVGATAVVLAGASVDPYNGKAVRASAGSLFHLPVVREIAVRDAIESVRTHGFGVLAADGAGSLSLDAAADSLLLGNATAWLFGNEARGLSAELRELADHVVRVPIYGGAESLNLATAAAVCLYASARAQRDRTDDPVARTLGSPARAEA
ncbi:MAG: TrmH family RNA methyltransferase [Nocardioidaceae bacterium]